MARSDDTRQSMARKWHPFFQSLSPLPRGLKFPKNTCDAAESHIIYHKSCCSLEKHLSNNQRQHPYLLAVGRQKSNRFYIALDKDLLPCQANCFLGAFDKLLKAHFVFNLSYDSALVNFYTFLHILMSIFMHSEYYEVKKGVL